jgi:hypothetical protein
MPQETDSFAKKMLPLFFLFIIVNSIILVFQQRLESFKIDPFVVFTANCLLFVLSVLTLAMHVRALNKTNPNVFIRSVMGATMIKMLVLASSAMIYLFMEGKNRSVYGVFTSMLLYIIYMVLEIRIALKLNQKK